MNDIFKHLQYCDSLRKGYKKLIAVCRHVVEKWIEQSAQRWCIIYHISDIYHQTEAQSSPEGTGRDAHGHPKDGVERGPGTIPLSTPGKTAV